MAKYHKYIHVCFQQHKTGSEIKMLEEMMFGAVGVAYKGTSLKVHVIR